MDGQKDSGIAQAEYACFIPSTCWRKIRTGILSTTRFAGILFIGKERLAVCDIGDGKMEWQLRAERSLFYRNYGERETEATGMLLICDEDKRIEVAKNIIRTTMWQRKQLIDKESEYEREWPVKYVRAPIRLAWYYEHVYLTTPKLLRMSIFLIQHRDFTINDYRGELPECSHPKAGDYEEWPYRVFVNITTDLLKYVYFFSAAKELMDLRKGHPIELNYAIVSPPEDADILNMYPDVTQMKGVKFHEHRFRSDD